MPSISCSRLFVSVVVLLIACACASKKTIVTPSAAKALISDVAVSDLDKKLMKAGLAQLESKNYRAAEKTFKQLAGQNENLVSPLLNLSLVYLRQDRLLEAESTLRQALNRNSTWPQTYNLLGVVLRQQGRFDDAKSAYTYALQLDDNYAKAHLNIAVLYDIYFLDLENAKRHYRRFVALQPEEEKQVNAWMIDMQQRAQVSN